ncbi:MAG: glycoside hydrolase family 3 C-terminal domain-containing protein [Lachnospiraceae bacterium]|nr:glycoside hydrolase family 3 C-terminal domain-containing protein [Lachnospiraceae bacterium]
MKKYTIKRSRAGRVLIVLLVVLTAAVNISCCAFQDTLDSHFGSQYALTDELSEAADELAQKIEGEGLVLLQNKNDTLPLDSNITRVNVFGWSSTQWISSGSGSGGSSKAEVDLLSALNEAGIEYNTELTDMYTDFLNERPLYGVRVSMNSTSDELCCLYEPSISDADYYSEELLANAESYSDTAIVVFGRYTGESNDCPKVQYRQTTKNGDVVTDETRTYLDLSAEEEELLVYVGSHYDKVIVLLNSTNQMSVGAIETTEGVDACLMVGVTGDDGTKAVVSALYGSVNPSGHLTDTWVYDLSASSTYANSGNEGLGYYTNGDGFYPADGSENVNDGDNSKYEGVAYVDYAEGIYIGYKWYETADAEGYWANVSNEHGDGYDGVVQYPFGYGLSYTEFEWEIVEVTSGELSGDDTVSITVRVTNTGDVAGKDVLQLYYDPPYYTGEIEKSSVNLADFAKTDLLEPGESQEVTLTLDVYDMASYDCYDANGNGFTGYELDAGDYCFMLSHNAHEIEYSFSCTISENLQFPEDPVTSAEVSNCFTGDDAVDGVSLDGSDSGAAITYLSRADFEGTFPSEVSENRDMTDNVAALNLYTEEMAEEWADENNEPITTGADNGLAITNADGTISELGYILGEDYDSDLWDELLDRLTIEEMEDMVLHAYCRTDALSSIGKLQTRELDGPTQIGSFSYGSKGKGFANPTTLAQTFNKDLAYEFGLTSGAEAVQLGLSGWYAPGANLHRSAFGGRNYEYYSEDSCLTGIFASMVVKGARNTGIYTFAKHFVACDQEAARDGVYVWMTEQALRENYLSPFRMLIEEAGCTGIMSSYNRLGAVWTGGSEALLTCVLREEWGFQGAVITDYADHQTYMNADQMLRAGGDLWMDGWLGNGSFMYETSSNSYQQALRRAAKNVTYMYLEAADTARQYREETGESVYSTEVQEGLNVWRLALAGFDVFIALIVTGYILTGFRLFRHQQE